MAADPGSATARGRLGGLLRAPWTARAWRDTTVILAGFPIALAASTTVVTLLALTASLAITAVLVIPLVAALFWLSRVFTFWQRARLQGFLGIAIPQRSPLPKENWLRGLWTEARTKETWRHVLYHLLAGVTGTVSAVVVAGFWTLGALFSTILLHGWLLPDTSRIDRSPSMFAVLTVLGLILLFAAPAVAEVAVKADTGLAKAFLTPSKSETLAQRVETLSVSRTEMIDAADAERRRIERNLHDGAQQRLVSLAMNLGMARTTLTEIPPEAREAIEQAHEEAKMALSELRDMVRGLHPAVLDDLGLDAALSGIAARSPVPVRLLVELPRRPPRAVETVAYFVVSESLTNAAKHAHASQVDIVVEMTADDILRIIVSDDGRGDADPARGTGLRGLAQRIGSVDGTMSIDSPQGGPTRIMVTLPCAW